MSEQNDTFGNAVPNPIYVSIAASVIRVIIAAAGGGLVLSDNQVLTFAGAVVIIGTGLWGIWQKVRANKNLKAAAVQSATLSANASVRAGAPVPVVVSVPARAKLAPRPDATAAELNREELERVRREYGQ